MILKKFPRVLMLLNKYFKYGFTQCICRRSHKLAWRKPDGYDTGIKVYVPFISEKVPLILKKKNFATWYMCGPTVYDDAHIGHGSCYVKFDIMLRIMQKLFNIEVVTLMGITDIDDKIIKKARKHNRRISDISEKYEKDFFQDLKELNVERPSLTTRVTDFIPQIISFCETLIKKDFAYVTEEGNVYFSVSKSVSESNVNEYHTIENDPLKKDSRDFALWKTSKPGEPSWDSPWGKGRPGWHIECSTMASCIFGDHIDIHSGGTDLMFPHHVNENSQSSAYHDCEQWVSYWFHTGLMNVGQRVKMSKSLQNMITIKDFLNYSSSNVFRIMCLQSHYRNDMDYSDEMVKLADALHSKLHLFLNDCEAIASGDMSCPDFDSSNLLKTFNDVKSKVITSFADDFNTYYAVTCISRLAGDATKCLKTNTKKTSIYSLCIIGAIETYINRILETVGVCITTKKKLPVFFLCFVDIITGFRSAVRQHALSFHPETVGSDCDHPDINTIREEAMSKLNAIGITFDSENKNIVSFGHSVLSCVEVEHIFDEFVSFNTNIQSIRKEFSATEYSDEIEMPAVKMYKKTLLEASDKFRENLRSVGIGIKDAGPNYVWFPIENHFKNISS